MIYKIIMEFNDLQELIKILSKDFDILFFNNCLYIRSKKMKNISANKIKKILKNDNVFLTVINDKNIKYEPNHIKDWCISYFVQKDIENFELQEQELLKQYLNVLDDCEKQLEKIIEKGDEIDGRTKNKG